MGGLTYSMPSLDDLFVNPLLLLGQHHSAFEDAGLVDAFGWRHGRLYTTYENPAAAVVRGDHDGAP
jgi:hypothetical protein